MTPTTFKKYKELAEENTNIDYTLCDLLEVCMDELDELPLADLNELRDLIRETN